MRRRTRVSGRCAAIAMTAALMGAAPAAAEQIGFFAATCQIAGAPAQMSIKYTVYSDAVGWQNQHGLHTGTTDMGGSIVYWEGRLLTRAGNYRIEGRNNLIEAFPDGGHYTDKVDLQVVPHDRNRFTLYTFPDRNRGAWPCQITAQQ